MRFFLTIFRRPAKHTAAFASRIRFQPQRTVRTPIKALVVVGLLHLAAVGTSLAQTCSTVPNNLTNGTTADATQVMANFNALTACLGNMRGYIGGLTLSYSTATAINIAAGAAVSDDATTLMRLSAASTTKNANTTWAAGSGGGCRDSATGWAAGTWYHLFVIARTDTGGVDLLCSTSATSPTLPSGYTKKRRIGSFRTANGATSIIPFSQFQDQFTWGSAVADVNVNNLGTTAVSYTLTVPPGVRVVALLRAIIGSDGFIAIFGPDETISGAASSPALASPGTGNWNEGVFNVLTNTSAQIRAIADAAGRTFIVTTYGWIDSRGQ